MESGDLKQLIVMVLNCAMLAGTDLGALGCLWSAGVSLELILFFVAS